MCLEAAISGSILLTHVQRGTSNWEFPSLLWEGTVLDIYIVFQIAKECDFIFKPVFLIVTSRSEQFIIQCLVKFLVPAKLLLCVDGSACTGKCF